MTTQLREGIVVKKKASRAKRRNRNGRGVHHRRTQRTS
jgi:hypothetical protein